MSATSFAEWMAEYRQVSKQNFFTRTNLFRFCRLRIWFWDAEMGDTNPSPSTSIRRMTPQSPTATVFGAVPVIFAPVKDNLGAIGVGGFPSPECSETLTATLQFGARPEYSYMSPLATISTVGPHGVTLLVIMAVLSDGWGDWPVMASIFQPHWLSRCM